MIVFKTKSVILYHYTLNNDNTWYNVCIAWFLDIRISICLVLCLYLLMLYAAGARLVS